MSDGHANLFASAVPANESSSTIGSNGDQPARNEHSEQSHRTNSSRETRNERNTSITAGEDADGQPEQQLPRDDDEDPDEEYSLEEESINLMDEIVENFRRKEITKLKALSNIISILNFNPSRTECAKDAAVEHYSCTLNEIEALATSAAQRGEHAQRGLQCIGERDIGTTHLGDEQHDAVIDDLIPHLSNESKRGKRPVSQDFIDDDLDSTKEPDIGDIQSNKKR